MSTRTAVVTGAIWAMLPLAVTAQTHIAAQVSRALAANKVIVVSVSIGDETNKATWTVQPTTLQAAAQPTIDAFDVNDPIHDQREQNIIATSEYDRRYASAFTWVLLRRVFPTDTVAQTKVKYDAMRDAVIAAAQAQPWK